MTIRRLLRVFAFIILAAAGTSAMAQETIRLRIASDEDIARQIFAFMTIGFATGSIVYLDGGGLVT